MYELERVYPDFFRLGKFARGAVATARAGDFVEDQLDRTNAAENVRKLKAKHGRKLIQKSEVITVAKCRKMISDRRDEKDYLKVDWEMKMIHQQRRRWGPMMRELVSKISYYIDGHSYGLSSM